MRARWYMPVLLVALVAALLAPTGVAAAGEPSPWLRPPHFTAVGGLEQVFVTDANPGDRVGLNRWILDEAVPRAEFVAATEADDFGSAMFREVEPGFYVVVSGKRVEWSVEVLPADGPHPDQSFYDGQVLDEGFTYIETRDGTLLSANVVLPGPAEDGPYPTVVEYSGYDPSNPTGGGPAQPGSTIANALGYAIVGVNVRGTGCSGGAYDFFETMQVLDGYDVIETVAAQPWVAHNHVGMVGLSYPGITQLFVAQSNPPSLAAITPLSVYGDTATGILAPGGLLNTGFATSWADNVLRNAQPSTPTSGPSWVRNVIADGDTTCADNQLLRLQNVNATEKARANPYYTDEVAGPLDVRNFVGDIEAPVFLASAYQDEQTGPSFGDLLGEFDSSPSVRATIYNGLHADGFAPQVLDEWSAFLDLYVAREVPSIPPLVRAFAPVLFAEFFGDPVGLPPDRWTDVSSYDEALKRWESEPEFRILMENGTGDLPGLPVAGWELTADEWPLPETHAVRYFLGAEGGMTVLPPDDPAGTGVAFHPDPAVSQTSFYAGGGIWDRIPNWNWVPQADGDNARFQTAPLLDDLTMIGTASVDLWLKSDADEAEIEAVISEITPEGNEVRVQAGQLQVSYRALDDSSTTLQPVQYGYEADWAPLVPGQWTEVRVQVPVFGHTFRAGSMIRLTINTPGGDTAQWEFELDGPGAEATHVIGTSHVYPSSVVMPLIPDVEAPTPLPGCDALRGQPCRPAPAIANDVVFMPPSVIGGDRPAPVQLPTDYDPAQQYPLVVVLHGFGAWGTLQAGYMGINAQVDERDFVLVMPDGTLNASGSRFWNAIPGGCCDDGRDIDDVAYITSLIEEAAEAYNIDPARVYLLGHSNGGMMSFTMACEASPHVTAFASFAGTSFADDKDCAPAEEPVSALIIHGTADGTVSYDPVGSNPGVVGVRDRHAALLGCDLGGSTEGDPLDLVTVLPGDDTTVEVFEAGCTPGTSLEVWTIEGGSHIPGFTPNFATETLDWLLAKERAPK